MLVRGLSVGPDGTVSFEMVEVNPILAELLFGGSLFDDVFETPFGGSGLFGGFDVEVVELEIFVFGGDPLGAPLPDDDLFREESFCQREQQHCPLVALCGTGRTR